MNATVAELLTLEIVLGSRHSSDLTRMADRNAVQGLSSIMNSILQSVGATADDAQLMAAMQTAAGTPHQGAMTRS